MIAITPSNIRRFLRRLHRSESGTAMTEFVITLPVYFVFLLGISSITTVHLNVLDSKNVASASLWEDAVNKQKGVNGIPWNMLPIGGAVEQQPYYGNIESYSQHGFHNGFRIMDTGFAATGTYPDLGTKSMLGQDYNNFDPKFFLDDILCTPSHTVNLFDDMMGPAPKGSGIWSSIMSYTGANLGIAAGVNYGITYGIDKRSFEYPGFGMSGEVQSHYVASVAPRATPHVLGSLMTWFELRGEDAYRDAARIDWWSPSSPNNGCKYGSSGGGGGGIGDGGGGGGGGGGGSTSDILDEDDNVVGYVECDDEGECNTVITDEDFADSLPDGYP